PSQPTQKPKRLGDAWPALVVRLPSPLEALERFVGNAQLLIENPRRRQMVTTILGRRDRLPEKPFGVLRLVDPAGEVAGPFVLAELFARGEGLGPQPALFEATGGFERVLQAVAVEDGGLAEVSAGDERRGGRGKVVDEFGKDVGGAAVAPEPQLALRQSS